MLAALTALAVLARLAQAQTTTRQISLPNQDYTESTQDLSVKVLGGQVTITRTYSWGKWYLNDAWADLVLQPDPMGGVLYVQRIDRVYARITNSDPTQALYSFDENNYIRTLSQSGQITGWQWYDREGNTINYDQNGHIQSYSNAAGIKVSFVYNAQNQMTGVQDHQGRQVISIDYSNGLPVKVSDASGRSVAYEWNLPAAINGISLAQLTKVTDVRGNTWSYTYTGAGYIQSRTDPAGGQIQLTYLTQPARQTNNRGGA
jgi:YD repeat-containing protein